MKLVAILPISVLLSGILWAQAPAGKPGSIQGLVINSLTSEPIKKAVVTLQGAAGPGPNSELPSSSVAMTGVSGQFHFDNVPPGSYMLSADRDGFKAEGQPHAPMAILKLITVTEEQHVQDVAIKLLPLGTVGGHVLDEDGDPIVRAQITVLRYSYGQGHKQLIQVAVTQANDLGEFDVLNLPPGRYCLQVVASLVRNIPPHTRWVHPEEAYPITFYPNASEARQATAIEVGPGAHVGNIDFRLRKLPSYHIRGTVNSGLVNNSAARTQDTQGRVTVDVAGSVFGAALRDSRVQSDGSFELRGLVSGSYTVTYQRFDQAKLLTTQEAVHVAEGDVNGVALTLKPAQDISGTVTVEGSEPGKSDLQVILSPEHVGSGGGNAKVGADGRFVLADAPPDRCQIELSNVPPGKYVKSIRFGDQEVKNGEVDLREHSNGNLNIALGADGGEVNGTVQTAAGQPAPSTLVTLAAGEEFDGRSDLFKQTFTDPGGNFRIEDVAPGDYKVFAWENDPDGSTQSAEFRKPFETKSVSVTVGPKVKTPVQLTVITADDVEQEMSKLP